MRFPMPNFPCDFELPDDWLVEAGLVGFTPTTTGLRSHAAAVQIPLTMIEPVYRVMTVPKDWRGFDRGRLISVLRGIVAGDEMEPVPLLELHDDDFRKAPYRYRVANGFHRYYASIAAGFTTLPRDI